VPSSFKVRPPDSVNVDCKHFAIAIDRIWLKDDKAYLKTNSRGFTFSDPEARVPSSPALQRGF